MRGKGRTILLWEARGSWGEGEEDLLEPEEEEEEEDESGEEEEGEEEGGGARAEAGEEGLKGEHKDSAPARAGSVYL